MNIVGRFEKVSFEQFYEAFRDAVDNGVVMEDVLKMWREIELPTRATRGSAGYDFKAPIGIHITPGETVKIPTGIRVKIADGWWLACVPRSSLGFKYRMQLNNTVGVIDSDYYYSDNEGHIFAKITNDSKEGKELSINAGDSFMQGIFIPFGITYDDDATATRNGGMGSTGS